MKGILHILLISGLMLMGACQSKQQMIEDAGTVLTDDNLPQWTKRLNEIPLPKYMQGDSLIDVYFKYNQFVNGYEVTARWRTFGKDVETGSVLLNFYDKKTGKEFQYFRKVYNSYDTDNVVFAKDFKGHRRGDVYYFNYTSPDTLDDFKANNGNSPLGYYTSFQFLDIDFDGQEELLVSDWSQGQGGNSYDVIKLTKYGLKELDYIPLDRLTNSDRIDLKNKTITLECEDGVFENAKFYFSSKERRNKITDLPEFKSSIVQGFDFEKYNNELSSPFVLDSIKERVKTDREYCESYIVCGNKLLRAELARKIPVSQR